MTYPVFRSLSLGPPGAGELMLARRLPAIPASDDPLPETIANTRIRSVAGLTGDRTALVTMGLSAAVLNSPPSFARDTVVDTTFPPRLHSRQITIAGVVKACSTGAGLPLPFGSWLVIGKEIHLSPMIMVPGACIVQVEGLPTSPSWSRQRVGASKKAFTYSRSCT